MKSPKGLNLQRGLMKLGHPADCNSKKETVQAKKERDNKNQKIRGLTNPQQKKE